jgi:EmrB/QacA subfamily drug resistance transporter
MSVLIVSLDTTIVNVALPAIHRSLDAPLSGLQWVIDSYTLVIASLLMLAGSTGDRVGRKRIFSIGLVVFTAGSALCAASPSLNVLVGARALQAVGGSMLNPVAMSIIRNVFEDPRERAQAIGVWAAMVGISLALGPIIGGALVDTVGWRFVFLVNIPVGVVAFVLTTLFVPESRAEHARRFDPVGQVLVIVVLSSLVYAIIEGESRGWTSMEILSLFAISLIAFVSLVLYELRRREPLLEVRFFRSAPFSGASVIAVCAFASLGGYLFLNTLYLQEVRHLSALEAGIYTLPIALMALLLAPISGRIVGRSGPRWPLLGAGLGMTLSPLLLTGLAPHTPVEVLLASYVLFGIGFGLVNTPITNTALAGMPASQAGVAAAVASTSRQVGQTLGIAVMGAVAGASGGQAFGPGFAAATHPAWWIVAGCGLIVLILGFASTTQRANVSAEAVTARLCEEPAAATP